MALLGSRTLPSRAAFATSSPRVVPFTNVRLVRPLTVCKVAADDEFAAEMAEEAEAMARLQAAQNVKREKPRSKRFKAMQLKLGGRSRIVEVEPLEAIRIARSTASTKFTESLEVRAAALWQSDGDGDGTMGMGLMQPPSPHRSTQGWAWIPSSPTSSCAPLCPCPMAPARSFVWQC